MSASSQPLLPEDAIPPTLAHDAAAHGDVAALRLFPVEMCMRMELWPAAKEGEKSTHWRTSMLPLHTAAAGNQLPSMDFLASLPGASVEQQDEGGRTPLMHAVAARSQEAVVWLAKRMHDLDALDNTGNAAIHWAVDLGSSSLVSLLVNLGASTEVLDKEGRTPLALAVIGGRLEIVEYLVLKHRCSDAIVEQAQLLVQDCKDRACGFWIARCLREKVGCHDQALGDNALCGPISGGWSLPLMARCCRGPEEVQVDSRQLSLFTALLCALLSVLLIAVPTGLPQAVQNYQRMLAYLCLCCTVIGWPCFYRASRRADGVECPERFAQYHSACNRAAAVTVADCDREESNWWGEVEPLIHQMGMVGPARSKYCFATRRCIAEFDHYCSFLRNSVSQDNYPAFAATVLLATVACGCMFGIAVSMLRAGLCVFPAYFIILWFGAFTFSGVFLCVTHCCLAWQGCTMYEMYEVTNGRMPAYMVDQALGDFKNPYRKGCVQNVRARLCPRSSKTAVVDGVV